MYAPLFEAIRSFFAQAQWRGESVLTVFAGPDRAHEEAQRIMARKLGKPIKEVSDRAMWTPFMSVWFGSPKLDQAKYNPHRLVFSKNFETGTALVARYPRPVTADVQVDLWCGSAGGHNMAQAIEAQVELRFFPEHIALPVDWSDGRWYKKPYWLSEHARYFGRTRLVLYTDGWADNSDLEAGEGAKEVRRTWSGRLEAFIPHRAEEARLVSRVEVDICDYNATVLDSLTVAEE